MTSMMKGVSSNRLMNVSIYRFNEDHILVSRIEAESANIDNALWILRNVREYEGSQNIITNESDSDTFKSIYDL